MRASELPPRDADLPRASRLDPRSRDFSPWELEDLLRECGRSPELMHRVRDFLCRAGRLTPHAPWRTPDAWVLRELGTLLRAFYRAYPLKQAAFVLPAPAAHEDRPAPPPPAEHTRRTQDFVELQVTTPWGAAVEDDSGFELLLPDGTREEGKLKGGRFRKDGVARGSARIRFRYLADCSWTHTRASEGDEVGLRVLTSGLPEGTEVTLKVYDARLAEAEGLQHEETVRVQGNLAEGRWRFTHAPGTYPGGDFVFEAQAGHNWASSGLLQVVPFALEDVRGVQQRLRQLGYAPGPLSSELTAQTREALKQLQEDAGLARPDGELTPLTRSVLTALVHG